MARRGRPRKNALRNKEVEEPKEPEVKANSEEVDEVSELIRRGAVCNTILSLKDHPGWIELKGEWSKMKEALDNHWHLVDPETDRKKLNEIRATKLAAVSLITALSKYEEEKLKIEAEIKTKQEPEKYQPSDYDPY